MTKPIYDDGTYVVTDTVVATPRRFYPVAGTTACIRRDPLWAACALAALSAASIMIYGDLLSAGEKAVLVAVSGGALSAGREVAVLSIDAVGHRRVMLVGRTKQIAALFRAIRSVGFGEGPRLGVRVGEEFPEDGD